MPVLTIAAFEALPDVSTAYGRRRVAVEGRMVSIPVMIEAPGALFQRDDDDGMFMDPRDRSTWMVGWVDGVRVRRRAGS